MATGAWISYAHVRHDVTERRGQKRGCEPGGRKQTRDEDEDERKGGRTEAARKSPKRDAAAVTPGHSPRPLRLCPRLEATPARFCSAVVLKRHANSPGPY